MVEMFGNKWRALGDDFRTLSREVVPSVQV